jgi:hypothetical protein
MAESVVWAEAMTGSAVAWMALVRAEGVEGATVTALTRAAETCTVPDPGASPVPMKYSSTPSATEMR